MSLPIRLRSLSKAGKSVADLPGSVAEVGVWRGTSAKHLTDLMPDRKFFLFDTFCGMPKNMLTKEDGTHWGGYERGYFPQVKKLLSRHEANIVFCVGAFPDTAALIPEAEEFCLVNIDVDIYYPTLKACEIFYPRMVAGGVFVLNDYRAGKCRGATKAIDKFFSQKPEKIVFEGVERTFVWRT